LSKHKFNIGDEVTIVANYGPTYFDKFIGSVCGITEVLNDDSYCLEGIQGKWLCSELKLVTSTNQLDNTEDKYIVVDTEFDIHRAAYNDIDRPLWSKEEIIEKKEIFCDNKYHIYKIAEEVTLEKQENYFLKERGMD
jgi:hypothetical protein